MATIFTLCGIALHWSVNGYFRTWKQANRMRYALAARNNRSRNCPPPVAEPSPVAEVK